MGVDTTSPHGEQDDSQDNVIARMLSVLASETEGKDDIQRAYAAAHDLARRGDAGVEVLCDIVLNWGDYGPSALSATIEGLESSKNPKAAALLRRVVVLPPAAGLYVEHLRALYALGHLGEAGARVLAEILQDPILASKARDAGWVLGSTGNEEIALEPLVAALSRHDSPLVAMDAANGLGKLKSLAAIPALITAMAEDIPIGNSAQQALHEIGEAAIPALIQALSNRPDVIRRRAAWILSWRAQNAQAFEALRAVLEDADAEVREAAIWAMHHHGGSDVLPVLEHMRAKSQENSENFDPLSEEIQDAIRAIKARIDDEIEPPVLDDEARAMEGFVPGWDVEASRTTASEIDRLLGELTADITDQEDRDRAQETAYSLLLQEPQGVTALIAVARNGDLDSDIRVAALDTLATSDDKATVLPPLLEALHNPELWLAMRAAYALGALGATAAIPDLVEMLIDDDAYSEGAKIALVHIGQASIPAILDVLAHGPEGKRRAATATLREMSADPRVAEAFVVALHDPDPAIRKLAIEGIAFPHDGWAPPHETSRTWSDSVRSDPIAAKAIQPLLDDPDASVQEAARRGLRAVGGQDDASLLERASRHARQGKDGSSSNSDPGQPTVSSGFPQDVVPHLRLLAQGATSMVDARGVWLAAQALGHLGAPGIDALIAVLRDPDLYSHSSRIWAIDALGASGETHALSPLMDILRRAEGSYGMPNITVSPYEQANEALRAAYALARLGAPGMAALHGAIADPHVTTLAQRAAEDALRHPLSTHQR
jgi:HEAT repeat protein